MALTKPRLSTNINTDIGSFADPILVLHQGSTLANVDSGFLFNRANGLVSNVALYWSESANSFVAAFTTSSGVPDANIAPTSFANVRFGTTTANVFQSDNYRYANGAAFVSTTIANTTEITANLTGGQNVGLNLTTTGVVAGNYGSATSIPTIVVDSKGRITSVTSNVVSTTINLAGGSGSGSVSGGGTLTVNGTSNQITTAVSASTITVAFAQDITAPGNVTIIGNLVVQGNTTTLNTETLTVEDLNITVANGAVNAAAADGAGLTVGGANARLLYKSATDSWVFDKGVFASGNLVANSGTLSSSVSTGALVVVGGMGISSNVTFGGNSTHAGKFIINEVTNAEPYIMGSGAFHVAGGMSIGKDFWIGGNLYVANVISQTSTIIQVNDPLVYLKGNNNPYNYDIGVFSDFTGGSLNKSQYTGAVRSYQTNEWVFFSNIDVAPAAGTVGLTNPKVIYDPVKVGNLVVANTTVSTSTATGALIVQGGAGVAGNVYADKLYTTTGLYWAGNGNAVVTGSSAFSNVAVTGGNTITANTVGTSTLTLVGGLGISIVADAATDTLTFTTVSTSVWDTDNDFGFLTDPVSLSYDNELVTDTVTESYDLGSVLLVGLIHGINILANTIPGDRLVTGTDIVVGNITASGNLSAGNISTGAVASDSLIVTANVTSGNISTGIITANTATFTANVTAGNVIATEFYPAAGITFADGTRLTTGSSTIATYDLDEIYADGSRNSFRLLYNQSNVTISSPWNLLVTINGIFQPGFSENYDTVWLSGALCASRGYTMSSGNIKFADTPPAGAIVNARAQPGTPLQITKVYPFKPIDIMLGM